MLFLGDKRTADEQLVGGKAAILARLFTSFTIPNGFVVLPEDALDQGIFSAFDQLQAQKVAVRSSATNEDSSEATWAGQLETFLNIERNGLVQAIQRCRESNSSERATVYASVNTMSAGKVAVLVQEMLSPRLSGVAFTKHPVSSAKGVVVEAVQGLGEQLVSGHTTPDTYVENGEKHIARDNPLLGVDELDEVILLAKNVRDLLGYEVDIEWAFSADTLYLLQARPITTL